jgi:DNA-binding NarL/FixJ family response regulator
VRVTIADDHTLFVQGLLDWLVDIGITVLGTARDATQLLEMVDEEQPDVAIVDASMPPGGGDGGLQAAETLATRWPAVGVLVVSAYVEAGWAARLLQRRSSGVGYLLKHNLDQVEQLHDALERIRRGEIVIDPEIVIDVMAQRSITPCLASLTSREYEVLEQVAQGRSNRGVATILGIEERTVENHVTNIFRKLDLPEGNQRVLAVLELQKGGSRMCLRSGEP